MDRKKMLAWVRRHPGVGVPIFLSYKDYPHNPYCYLRWTREEGYQFYNKDGCMGYWGRYINRWVPLYTRKEVEEFMRWFFKGRKLYIAVEEVGDGGL